MPCRQPCSSSTVYPAWLLLRLWKFTAAKAENSVGARLQGREPVGLLESGEVVCSRGIKPALEEQKPALLMERFPRQSGTAGLSVLAGALVCRRTVLLSTDVPAMRGSKQAPLACACDCRPRLAEARLVKTLDPPGKGADVTELQNVGCVWPGKLQRPA